MMGRCALLLVVGLLCAMGCGGESAPAFIPPGVDGGDEDAEAGSGGAGTGGGAGMGGAGMGGAGMGGERGDHCEDHLSGISCQVEEIAALTGGFCARFTSGDVKCWGALPNFRLAYIGGGAVYVEQSFDVASDAADDWPFNPIRGVAQRLYGDHELCIVLSDTRADCGDYFFELTFEAERPLVGIGTGLSESGLWFLFGDERVTNIRIPHYDNVITEEVVLPFVPTAISSHAIQGRGPTCAITEDGDVRCWGNNVGGILGVGDTEPRTPETSEIVPLGEPVQAIATAEKGVCALTDSGRVKCWGPTGAGDPLRYDEPQGDEAGEIEMLSPIRLHSNSPVIQLTMSEYDVSNTICAVQQDGNLTCWGYNGDGECGQGSPDRWLDPSTTASHAALPPIDLGTGRRALQVAATIHNVCALLDDHSVKCWGGSGWNTLDDSLVGDVGDAPNEMGDNLPRINFGTLTRAEIDGFPPDVSVVSPPQATGLDDISTADTLTVTCDAQPHGDEGHPVDPGTLALRLFGGAGNSVEVRAVLGSLVSGTHYSATLVNLSSLPTGRYVARCEASTASDPPLTGSADVYILHDGGPTIEMVRPMAGAILGQDAAFILEVDVTAAELGTDDVGAAVTGVQFSVAGQVFAANPTNTPGRYRATIDPRSSVFASPLSGPTLLTVRATNTRGVTATLETQVTIDGVGPTIVIGPAHNNGRLVRGAQQMQITLTDALAGVDATAGYGRIGAYTFPLTLEAGDNYRGVFDTLRFDRTVSQLTIEIHAFDLVGNETIVTRSIQLDNQPPIISLDPPDVREFKNGVGNTSLCSVPFDPVGSDSISDGDVAPAGAEFRVRVEDETNGLEGEGVLSYLALVDPARVRIYMQSDQTAPILIDTNGDGTCDEVNDEVSPRLRNLVPITPAGKSHYADSAPTDGLSPTWPGWCDAGTETVAPPLLCSATSPLTRVIKANVLGLTVPAIYGLAPANTVSCVGDSWDWRPQFPQGGPVCVVARAEDTLGNVGVSVPLRVCLQTTGPGAFNCASDLSWQNHDCLAGTYGGASVQCDPPPDYLPNHPFDFVREDSPR